MNIATNNQCRWSWGNHVSKEVMQDIRSSGNVFSMSSSRVVDIMVLSRRFTFMGRYMVHASSISLCFTSFRAAAYILTDVELGQHWHIFCYHLVVSFKIAFVVEYMYKFLVTLAQEFNNGVAGTFSLSWSNPMHPPNTGLIEFHRCVF